MRRYLILIFWFIALPAFAYDRANAELDKTIRFLAPSLVKDAKTIETFESLTQPYGPYDLLLQGTSSLHSAADKNFFYGVMLGGVDQSGKALNEHQNRFFNNPQTTIANRNHLLHISQLRELAGQFIESGLAVVGQYGDVQRVDQAFWQGNNITAYDCAKAVYFPCPQVSHYQRQKVPAVIARAFERAQPLLKGLKTLNVVALVKESIGTRVIFDGYADNEYGVLLLTVSEIEDDWTLSGGSKIDNAYAYDEKAIMYRAN